MKARFIIIALAAGAVAFASAQKTTRAKLKADTSPAATAQIMPADTIWADSCATASLLGISGYEKTLRSSVESVFLTNHTADTITGVGAVVEYLDMSHRQLHERTVEINTLLPPRTTRMAQFPSWDKQKVWYYHLSSRPNTRYQATPYRVKISLKYILTQK